MTEPHEDSALTISRGDSASPSPGAVGTGTWAGGGNSSLGRSCALTTSRKRHTPARGMGERPALHGFGGDGSVGSSLAILGALKPFLARGQ